MKTLKLRTHYTAILESTVNRVQNMLRRQVPSERDELTSPRTFGDGNALYEIGGFRNHADGMVHPGTGTGSLISLIPLLVNRDSVLNDDERLVAAIERALDYAREVQRPDGTFDLLPSNFFSSPDCAFIMHNLVRAYRILVASDSRYPSIEQALLSLVEETGRGMVGNGFHTPNHRWVIAAALAMANNVVGDPTMLDEAMRYLAEGIDIDENGEYTERSSGIYNAVNDNAFLILAEELKDDSFLDPVVKNLEMMFAYVEPDGSLFTWNSTRQDKGEGGVGGRFLPTSYYPLYLAMMQRRYDGRYAFMADSIFESAIPTGTPYGTPAALYRFMLDPELREAEYEVTEPDDSFQRFFEGSQIARIRRGGSTATILAGSSSFLFVQAGRLRCRVKLCASFFAVAQFIPESLVYKNGEYKMRFETHADYRLPLDPPPESPVWNEMDHTKRVHVLDQVLIFEATVRENESGVTVEIASQGCDRVPVKVEFIVTPGSVVTGDSFALPARPGGSITAGVGSVSFSDASDRITIGPAFAKHWYTESMRGSESQSQSEFTLYFTGYTPIDKSFEITTRDNQ